MKKTKKIFISLSAFTLCLVCSYKVFTEFNLNPNVEVGQEIDSLDGVSVYFNGGFNNVTERNLAKNGYNLGLKYQCVEFVKRYYFEHFNHQMPDSYGHARDFFDKTVKHAALNKKRNLYQYRNGESEQPKHGDLLVLKPTLINRFGHVSIISEVDTQAMTVEVIQQNPGPFGDSRELYLLSFNEGKWRIENDRVIAWLRK